MEDYGKEFRYTLEIRGSYPREFDFAGQNVKHVEGLTWEQVADILKEVDIDPGREEPLINPWGPLYRFRDSDNHEVMIHKYRWWWRDVYTESAMYYMSFDTNTLVRWPTKDRAPAHMVASLRKDRESIAFRLLSKIEVGKPMILELDIRNDGVKTVRTTTPVVKIK